MFHGKKAVLITAVLLVFGLATSVAMADQDCRRVKSKMTELGDLFVAADGVCNGYDFCQYADFKGFPKGRLWGYWNAEDQDFVFDDTFVLSADDTFEARDGNIFAQERGIATFLAPDGFLSHIAITGGTGRYDGAYGWMAWTFAYMDEQYGWLRGEICGPYIRHDDDNDSDDD